MWTRYTEWTSEKTKKSRFLLKRRVAGSSTALDTLPDTSVSVPARGRPHFSMSHTCNLPPDFHVPNIFSSRRLIWFFPYTSCDKRRPCVCDKQTDYRWTSLSFKAPLRGRGIVNTLASQDKVWNIGETGRYYIEISRFQSLKFKTNKLRSSRCC